MPKPLEGYPGLGDLVLTCSTAQIGAIMRLGSRSGRGRPLGSPRRPPLGGRGRRDRCRCLWTGQRIGIEMPISAAVEAVLHRGASIDTTIDDLLSRPRRRE